jgi:hypothetical protein
LKTLIITALSASLVTTVALAYEIHHPNLRDAHHEVENAIHHIQDAQKANHGIEFGGHAEKAVDLLRHAQDELVEGDKFNDARRH